MNVRGCDITLVTYARFPELTPDDALLARALRRLGASVRIAIWDDAEVDWAAAPVTVIRSTWDYITKVGSFRAWLAHAKTRTCLVNAAQLIDWNLHKSYLHVLESRGVPILPTEFFVAGEAPDLVRTCRRRGWTDVVVKPAISGSSYETQRFAEPALDGAGQLHLNRLLATRDAMVQPYYDEVSDAGERGMIYVAGTFSHAYRKTPFSTTLGADDASDLPLCATSDERAFAAATLAALGEVPTYARVDVLPTATGLRLMELELIDPALHFGIRTGSATLLAGAILEQSNVAKACA